jgi:hypothetical protein
LFRLEERLPMPKYLLIGLSIATLLLFSATDQARSDEIPTYDEMPEEEIPTEEEPPTPTEASEPAEPEPEPTDWTPFQLSFFSPVQFFPVDHDVLGVRVSAILGNNADITGIDVGGIGVAKAMTGLQANLAYNGTESLDGMQIASINQVTGRVRGAQIGGIVSHADEVVGVQFAPLHNLAETVTGVQIGGMINETEELRGVQFGLINFNWSRPFPFQMIPFISIGFGYSDEDGDN